MFNVNNIVNNIGDIMKHLLLCLLLPLTAFAQFDFSADLVSRYVWRGLDFGQSPAFQPDINFEKSGVSFGAWGSYALDASPSAQAGNELDFYIGYSEEIMDGHSIGATVIDYTFPVSGANSDGSNQYTDITDFSEGGSHTIEVSAFYEGMVNLAYAINVYNDDYATNYLRLGYPITSTSATDLEVFVGGTLNESPAYGTTGAAVTEVGLGMSKDVKVNDQLSLGTSATLVFNPVTDQGHFFVGVGF